MTQRATIAGACTATLMIAQQVGGKATRDALFLTHLSARQLPTAMILSALLSVAAVLLMSRLLSRLGPRPVVPAAFALSAALFLFEWRLASTAPQLTAWMVYLHMAALGAVAISAFWSLVSERFDPFEGKRAMARIGAGATFGGVLGGLGAERIAGHVSLAATLLVLAALNLACALSSTAIGGPKTPREERAATARLQGGSYLKRLAAMVALIALSGSLLDYALKAQAELAFTDGSALLRFFGLFYTATSVLAFLLQLGLAKSALMRFGLGGTLAVLPISTLAFGALAASVGQLWAVAIVRGSEVVVSNSLYRSAYELLYTPIPAQQKRSAKTIVDVAFERAGTALGAGLVLVALALAPASPASAFVWAGVAIAAVALWNTQRVHRGYVEALASSLQSGAVQLDEGDVLDATTRQTLTQTTMALDREKLLSEIERMRRERISKDPAASTEETPLPAPTFEHVENAEELLRRRPLPVEHCGKVIPLLARRDLMKDAVESLASVVDRVVGQLIDALLDKQQGLDVRRRIPRVLARSTSARAIRGLVDGLEHCPFEVRFECGRALQRMLRREGTKLPADKVFPLALRELEGMPAADAGWSQELLHAFGLLELHLDSDALTKARTVLQSGDPNLRGTALEYLDVVLPKNVRNALWPHIRGTASTPKKRQTREQALDALLISAESLAGER